VAAIVRMIDRVLQGAVALLMAIIVVTVACDVVGRYGFGRSLLFSNELSRLAFIWMTFLVMPLGIAAGLHVAITSVLDSLPPAARALLYRTGVVAMLALMAVVLAGAWVSIGARANERLNTLPLSAAWFYYPLAIGAAWSIVHLLIGLVRGAPVERPLAEGAEPL
jgi:TRAP-type C4-dicarboxylate transport system permease small subunit